MPEPKGDMADLRSIQMLVTVSIIAGPVSMLVGGVLLSLVAIVCAALALAKLRHVKVPEGTDQSLVQAVRRQAMVGVGIGVVALVLNAVSLALILPALLEAVQTGDFSALLGSAGAPSTEGAAPAPDGGNSSSIWG